MNQEIISPTIPSKRFDVWTRLYRRFLLEPDALVVGSRAHVGLGIIPVTDADKLLRLPDVEITNVATAETGALLVRTVPVGERWTIQLINVDVISGVWTHSNVQLQDPGGDQMTVAAWSSSSGLIITDLNKDLVVDEGWSFHVNISAFTSTGTLRFKLLKLVEDAF